MPALLLFYSSSATCAQDAGASSEVVSDAFAEASRSVLARWHDYALASITPQFSWAVLPATNTAPRVLDRYGERLDMPPLFSQGPHAEYARRALRRIRNGFRYAEPVAESNRDARGPAERSRTHRRHAFADPAMGRRQRRETFRRAGVSAFCEPRHGHVAGTGQRSAAHVGGRGQYLVRRRRARRCRRTDQRSSSLGCRVSVARRHGFVHDVSRRVSRIKAISIFPRTRALD